MPRFTRTKLLLGERGFAQLRHSHVVVVGLGAVGGYAVEALARAGIGRLTLVDFDTIQPANFNRQLLALETTLGHAKTDAARQRIFQIYPHCQVRALQLFVDGDTAEAVLEPQPDLLIDAIDALNPKTQLLTASKRRGIETLSSMGASLRTDPAQIRTGDISETSSCPLARRLRKRLRSAGIDRGIFCVYSIEPVSFQYQEPETTAAATPQEERGRRRRTLGSLPTLTGIFGLILANQAILHLSSKDP